jgi:hypothetical protein
MSRYELRFKGPSVASIQGIHHSSQDAIASHMHREHFKFVLTKIAPHEIVLECKGYGKGFATLQLSVCCCFVVQARVGVSHLGSAMSLCSAHVMLGALSLVYAPRGSACCRIV